MRLTNTKLFMDNKGPIMVHTTVCLEWISVMQLDLPHLGLANQKLMSVVYSDVRIN